MEIHIQWRLRKGMLWVQNLSSTQSWIIWFYKFAASFLSLRCTTWLCFCELQQGAWGDVHMAQLLSNCSKQHEEIHKMAMLFASFMCFMRCPATGWKPMEWNAKGEDLMTSCIENQLGGFFTLEKDMFKLFAISAYTTSLSNPLQINSWCQKVTWRYHRRL
jgi:hypothetical protein